MNKRKRNENMIQRMDTNKKLGESKKQQKRRMTG